MPSTSSAMLDAVLDQVVADWLTGLDRNEAGMVAALAPDARIKLMSRLRGVIGNSCGFLSPAEGAALSGLETGRFYQILRAWSDGHRLSSLGIRDGLGKVRAERLPVEDAAAKRKVQDRMREMLAAERPLPTEKLLDEIAASEGARFSRLSLLRWLSALKRELPARQVGRSLSLDFCALDRVRPEGGAHVGAFVVDRHAKVVLGGVIVRGKPDLPALYAAIDDALLRLPGLQLDRSPVAPRVDRLYLAAAGLDPVEAMRLVRRAGLPKRRVHISRGNEVVGRSVRDASGGRLGRIRLPAGLPAAFASGDDGRRVVDYDRAAGLLRDGLDSHGSDVRVRQAQLPTVAGASVALERVSLFLAGLRPVATAADGEG